MYTLCTSTSISLSTTCLASWSGHAFSRRSRRRKLHVFVCPQQRVFQDMFQFLRMSILLWVCISLSTTCFASPNGHALCTHAINMLVSRAILHCVFPLTTPNAVKRQSQKANLTYEYVWLRSNPPVAAFLLLYRSSKKWDHWTVFRTSPHVNWS